MKKYILRGTTPVSCEDIHEWGKWFEKSFRHVGFNSYGNGSVKVSTVFLGLDHGFVEGQEPILFETMVFGGPLNDEMWRYSTWEQAEIGHRAACALVEKEIEKGEQKC